MKIWWVRTDPCGIFSAILTVGLVLFAFYVIVKQILLPWTGFSFHVIFYAFFSILSLVSHTRAQFTDPGVIPTAFTPPPLPYYDPKLQSPYPIPPGPKICRVCRTMKTPQTYHCGTCNRCIIRMDHHCPWVNNCVAIHNQKYFILFLFYTAVCCLYSAVILGLRFASCSSYPRQCNVTSLGTALGIATFIEALIFGLFVIIMLFDQLNAIFEGNQDELQYYRQQLSAYEYNKRHDLPVFGPEPVKPKSFSKYESLCFVFGESFSWRWLFPFDMPKAIPDAYNNELQVGQANANTCITNIKKHISLAEIWMEKDKAHKKSSEIAALDALQNNYSSHDTYDHEDDEVDENIYNTDDGINNDDDHENNEDHEDKHTESEIDEEQDQEQKECDEVVSNNQTLSQRKTKKVHA